MIDAECRNLHRQIVPVLELNSIETMRPSSHSAALIAGHLTRS
jgi:hypothetical protein